MKNLPSSNASLPSLAQIKAEKLRRLRLKLEADHLEFTKHFFRIRQGIDFRVNWHHVYIADTLEQVIRGEIKNVVFNVSPGSSKTEEVVINFIARGLALNARARFLHISYSDDLAVLNSETAREVVRSEEYQQLWPRKIATDADSKKRWNVEDNGKKAGGVYATSLGGQITGFRAGHMAEGWQGCFPVGTRVWTERGLIPIDRIVRERMAIKVWAFDYAGNMVLRDVIAWHENPPNEIVRVTFDDGASVECTPDHRFWTLNRGWVRADSLCIDDRLPCVNGRVQRADDIGIDAKSGGSGIPTLPVLATSSVSAVGKGEISLCSGKDGAQVRSFASMSDDVDATRHGLPGVTAPYLAHNANMDSVLLGDVLSGDADSVVNRQSLLVGENRGGMDFSLAEGPMPLAIEDVRKACVVSKIGEPVIRMVPVVMADLESIGTGAAKGRHNGLVDSDSLNALGSHACVEPHVPARLALQGNDALALDELHAVLSDDRSGFAANAPQVGHAVGAFISGDRSPVLFERVRHDESTFCLTVNEYHNFTVESGIVVKNCILIDDPLKVEDAYSKTNRDKANRKLISTVKSRRANPDTPIVVIMQRLAEEDPTGFIKAGGIPGEWTFIEIPALITDEYVANLPEHIRPLVDSSERDEDGRFSYWPYKEPLQELLAAEKADRYVFSGQYMQRPSPLGGGIIRSAAFQRYTIVPQMKYRMIYADTAQKTAERNDYSVFECWGLGLDNRIYLLDMIRGKWQAPELRQRAIDFWAKHAASNGELNVAPLRKMKIEDKASGTGLIQDIHASGGIPVEGIERNRDKLTRVMDVVSYIDSGLVCIPFDAPFVSDFVTECESFTADDTHAHDDQIDPMCDAINDMLAGAKDLSIWARLAG